MSMQTSPMASGVTAMGCARSSANARNGARRRLPSVANSTRALIHIDEERDVVM